MIADKNFFDTVRPSFGKLTQGQVNGLINIVDYANKEGYSKGTLSYALATADHETARWMQPIREGARKYGPSYTDAQSRRAVESIYRRGIIRTNYALPTGPYNQSYYGRGLVQITWHSNYKKMGDKIGVDLEQYPDKALEWDVALPLLFVGIDKGLYTGKKIGDYSLFDERARGIINGDVKQNGAKLSSLWKMYHKALG